MGWPMLTMHPRTNRTEGANIYHPHLFENMNRRKIIAHAPRYTYIYIYIRYKSVSKAHQERPISRKKREAKNLRINVMPFMTTMVAQL